jgi:hypothetical protein
MNKKLIKLKALTDPSQMALLEALKQSPILKGEDGYTPVKGVDYFTEDEINQVADYIQSNVKPGPQGPKGDRGEMGPDGYTPKKGVDYVDGKNGYIPVKGVDYFTPSDKAEIVSDTIKAIKIPDTPKAADIVKQVQDQLKKETKPLHLQDINGTKELIEFLKLGGYRGGGGNSNITGLIQAGTNITITGSGTSIDPYIINSSGGSGSSEIRNETPTGAVDGTNTTFTTAVSFVLRSTEVYYNRVRQVLGIDYTEISDTQIQFTYPPENASFVRIDYETQSSPPPVSDEFLLEDGEGLELEDGSIFLLES